VTYASGAAGPQTAKVTLATNDPVAACATTDLQGNGTTTDIRVTGSTAFGVASVWDPAEKIIRVCNTGACNLSVSSVTIGGPDFSAVSNPFPATVSPDSCLDFTAGFIPILPGRRTGTLTVVSNDPDTPSVVLGLTGRSPSYFSLHGGAVFPHGVFNTVADVGSTATLAFTYPFRPRWAWDVRVGYASFNGAPGSSDTDVWNVLGNAKYTFNPAAAGRVFVNGGAGLYHFDPGDAEFGFNLGAGVQAPVGNRFAVEATYNYHHALTASPNRRYSQVQGGLIIFF
jgi:opacity protein-like surface antigen